MNQKKKRKYRILCGLLFLTGILLCACAAEKTPQTRDISAAGSELTETTAASDTMAPADGSIAGKTGEEKTSVQTDRTLIGSFRRTVLENGRWREILKGLGVTVFVIVLTLITSFLFGAVLVILVYNGNPVLEKITKVLVDLMKLIPVNTWLLVIYLVLFRGSPAFSLLVVVIALTTQLCLPVYSNLLSSVNGVHRGEIEATYTMGYGKMQALSRILLPQALPGFWDSMENDVVNHVRSTSLVGMVGMMDIQAVVDGIAAETAEPFMPLCISLVAYALLAYAVSELLKMLIRTSDKTRRSEAQIRKRIAEGRF